MQIINLIDYTDIDNCNGNIILVRNFNNLVKDKLFKGFINNKLINTQGLRGIGKTYQLINFAKEHNYIVVVGTSTIALEFRKKYNYEKIYGQNDTIIRDKEVVIDELVDIQKLKNEYDCKIITGYIIYQDEIKYILDKSKNNLKETEINLDLDDEIIQSLKKDIKSLLSKLETSLNNSNDSNYKMLINNLRETVALKNELEQKDKSNIQNYTVNIPNMNEIADYTIEKISKEMINKIKESGIRI